MLERRDGPQRHLDDPPRHLQRRSCREARLPAAVAKCRIEPGAWCPGRPPREVDTPLLFPGTRGGLLNLNNFRRRVWCPAVDASNALAAGVSVFELARIMGTSVEVIERSYGTLIEGAGADIARRLSAFETADEIAEAEQG